MDRRCRTCGWWDRSAFSPSEYAGRCRVRPPVVVALGEDWRTVWPETGPQCWCGEWQKRESADASDG